MGRDLHNAAICADEHLHEGFERTLHVLGDKWTIALLHHLVQGRNRFGALQRSMQGISPKTLSLRLRRLEAEGIVTRKIYPEVPLHIEYRLTARGRALHTVIEAMDDWGHEPPGAALPADDLEN